MPITSEASGGKATLLARYSAELGRIMDRGQAELALLRQREVDRLDALMRNIVEQSFDGILSIDENGRVKTANEAALSIFGCTAERMTGCALSLILPDLEEFRRVGAAHAELGGDRLEGMARRLDGTIFPVELSLRLTRIDHERRLIAIVRDISDAKEQEGRLRHLAMHDSLTGLPNRLLLRDRLNQALRSAERKQDPLALLLLDLDRFKAVNDTLGHHVGDMLLIDLAKRLLTCIRRSDTIARLGGDEFAILLPGPSDLGRATEVSERIVQSVLEPFAMAGGLQLEVGVSIGIALYPDHADDDTKLMQCADVAMYGAKRGTSSIEVYDRHKDHNTVRHLTLSGSLRQAIEGSQLSFEFQPKLDLRSNCIASVEALARWLHPTQGLIPPDEFVPQIEHSGLIQPFARWSFSTAFAQLATWHRAGLWLSLAINLSPRSLHDEDLPTLVRELLTDARIDPSTVTIELTESAVMLNPDNALANLRQLHALGLRLSMDDFGTGYSSLSHLHRLPLDELKIDKSFVTDMITNEQDYVIVRSTIDLAHNLGLKVVAEGIEHADHVRLLQELGCDFGQGFFIAEPIALEDLDGWLEHCPWPLRRRDPAMLSA